MMQEDLYGLRLSTTPEAAQAYNAGLRRILMVQAGPELDLRAAVRADPGFGLAHAGLALLGHEYGAAGVNVSQSLAAAAAAGPVFPAVIAPLVAGLRAYVEGRYDAAATLLMAVRRNEVALGGSAAQREVIEDTLLDALLAAGWLAQARLLLEHRLDRRPSRRDQRRLYQLTGFPESRPA